MFSFRKDLYFLFGLIASTILVSSCKFQTIDIYEKNVPLPKHEWSSSYRPQFIFDIEDTSVAYDIFIVLRHNAKYNWNNVWLELTTKIPGDTAIRRQKFELGLANNNGWLGVAMDDIYEQRVLIRPGEEGPLKKGQYEFTIGHVMREDPLQNIMNIGLRVEKKTASQAQLQ
jgi:gliding motility-associated lipoprotein GldH